MSSVNLINTEDDSLPGTAMPRNEYKHVQSLLTRKKRNSGRTENHVRELQRITDKFYKYMKKHRHETNPRKIAETVIRNYMKTVPPRSRVHQLSAINSLLKVVKNTVIEEEGIEYPRLPRENVDWLNLSQTEKIREVLEGEEIALFHLALDLCLRRSEIKRLKVENIREGYLYFLGKGTNGGKPRQVPFQKATERILKDQLERREQIIKKSKRKANIPSGVFLTRSHRWGLSAIKDTTMDERLQRISKRIGIHFSWHTLRRTGARFLWEAGVPVETIAQILGHSNTQTTLKYIGVNITHMTSAFEQLEKWKARCTQGDKPPLLTNNFGYTGQG